MLEFKNKEIEEISDVMKSIFQYCREKKIELTILHEGTKNEIVLDLQKKQIVFTIPNMEDKELLGELKFWQKKLKESL